MKENILKFSLYILVSILGALYVSFPLLFLAMIIFSWFTIKKLFYNKKSVLYILLYIPLYIIFLGWLRTIFSFIIFLLLIVILLSLLDDLVFWKSKERLNYFIVLFVILICLFLYFVSKWECNDPAWCWILFILFRWIIFTWILYLVLIKYIFSIVQNTNKNSIGNHNHKINKLIKDINIENYKQVKLICNDWNTYIVKLKNLMKIIKYILDKTWKTQFKPKELEKTFSYAVANYKTNLSEEGYKKVLKSLEKFVELWGKVEVEYKN